MQKIGRDTKRQAPLADNASQRVVMPAPHPAKSIVDVA